MSLNFMAIVPELKEYLELGATLGELLGIMDDNALLIAHRLAVPVELPPAEKGDPQSKDIMTTKEHQALTTSFRKRKASGDLQVQQDRADPKRQLSQTQYAGTTHVSTCDYKSTQKLRDDFHPSGLQKLSEELVLEILRYADDGSIAYFGLSHSRMDSSRIARAVLEERITAELGTWAGKKLLCLGDLTELGDMPNEAFRQALHVAFCGDTTDDTCYDAEVASKTEISEPQEDHVDTNGQDDDVEESDDTNDATVVFGIIYNGWTEPNVNDSLPRTFIPGYNEGNIKFLTDFVTYGGQRERLVALRDSVFYPNDHPWILRNLTTREFVRASVIALEPEYIHGPSIDFIYFGEVVLVRTCWATDPDVGFMDDGSEIHRGVWAGHAFDITTVAHHDANKKEEIWTDVSAEVSSEMKAIYQLERYLDS